MKRLFNLIVELELKDFTMVEVQSLKSAIKKLQDIVEKYEPKMSEEETVLIYDILSGWKMNEKIDERLLQDIEKITSTNYDYKNEILPNSVLTMLENLMYEAEHLKDELKGLQQNLEDNYRAIPYAEQVGISDRDFI